MRIGRAQAILLGMPKPARLKAVAAAVLSALLVAPSAALAQPAKEALVPRIDAAVTPLAGTGPVEAALPAGLEAVPELPMATTLPQAETGAAAAKGETGRAVEAAGQAERSSASDDAASAAEASREFDHGYAARAAALRESEAAKYSAANSRLGLFPARMPLSLGDYFFHWTAKSKDLQRLGRKTMLRPTVELMAATTLPPFNSYWRKMKGVLDFIDRVEANRPEWATANKVVLDKPSFALRDFSTGAKNSLDPGKTPVLIVPPNSGHLSTIADYEDGKSIVQTMLGKGRRTLAVDWKSASPENIQLITDMVHDVVKSIDAAGGKVQLVGLCQGGWVAAIVNALYPEKVEALYLAGTPLDATRGDNQITRISKDKPMEFFNWMVHGIGLPNVQDGENQLEGFMNLGPDNGRAKKIDFWTELFNNIEDPAYVTRAERFARWFYHVNHLSLWYLEAIEKLFKGNELYKGKLRIQVGDHLETVDLSRIKNPIVMFEGTKDDITPPATLEKASLRGVVKDVDAAWAFLNKEGFIADTGEELINRKPGELAVVEPKLFDASFERFSKLDRQASRALFDLLHSRQGQSFALENVAGAPADAVYKRTLNVGHIGLYNSGKAQEQWAAALDWATRRAAREKAAPGFEATDTGVVRVPNVDEALKALRAGSYPRDAHSDGLIARIARKHRGLPLAAERVFVIKDEALLAAFELPDAAGGAARLLTDGRRTVPVVLLAAPRGIELDDYIEHSIHEAVHLADKGILRVPHDRILEHWLAEGYTQHRAHGMANVSRIDMGLAPRSNKSYRLETALAVEMIGMFGEEPFRLLVEKGDASALRKALGARWDGLQGLIDGHRAAILRDRKLFLMILRTVVEHPEFGPADFARAAESLEGKDREIKE